MMSEEILDLDHSGQNSHEGNTQKKLSSSAGDILIQDSESVQHSDDPLKKKVPRRRIHFSDGVIEEYSTDEESEPVPSKEDVSSKECTTANNNSTNPKDLKWVPWILYYASFSGCSTLRFMESIGEKLGWFFGITSPKYYYEIEEFKRTKKMEEETKAKIDSLNWNKPPSKDQSVITLDPKKLSSDDFTELSLKAKGDEESMNV